MLYIKIEVIAFHFCAFWQEFVAKMQFSCIIGIKRGKEYFWSVILS